MNLQDLTQDQIFAFNEMAQLIMDKTGCSSEEAFKQITAIYADMLNVLNEGVLSE